MKQQQLEDRGQAGMKRSRQNLSEREKERDSEEKGSALAGKFGRINSVLPHTSAQRAYCHHFRTAASGLVQLHTQMTAKRTLSIYPAYISAPALCK